MGREKRKYPRVAAKNVSAHVNVADQSSPCEIQDISAGGMFIATQETLPVGMPVAVNLAQPGWSRALKLAGRVVWAMAERTAQRKGGVPGMRVKFDPLPREAAEQLQGLLSALGAEVSPPPVVAEEARPLFVPPPKDPAIITQPVSLKEIQARISQINIPVVAPLSAASKVPDTTIPQKIDPSTFNTAPSSAHAPKPNKSSQGGQAASTPMVESEPGKLMVQVQGLMMQLGELQSRLELRERELESVREKLREKETELSKADRERKAAELAIQRLSMQLSVGRR